MGEKPQRSGSYRKSPPKGSCWFLLHRGPCGGPGTTRKTGKARGKGKPSKGKSWDKGKSSKRSEEAIARRLARGLARRLQRDADEQEELLTSGRERADRERGTASDFRLSEQLSYAESLALQGGHRQNLEAVPEVAEFVGREDRLLQKLEPADRNSVNYNKAQQARRRVFAGIPFAEEYLLFHTGRQARQSWVRDEAARKVAQGPAGTLRTPSSSSTAVTRRPGSDEEENETTSTRPATTELPSVYARTEPARTYPATTEYSSEAEDSETCVATTVYYSEAAETHPATTRYSSTEAESEHESSDFRSSAGSSLWNRDREAAGSWEYRPYYQNYRWQDTWSSWRQNHQNRWCWGRDPY